MPGQHSTRGPHTLWRLRSLCLAGPEPLWEYPGFFRPTRTGQEKNKKKQNRGHLSLSVQPLRRAPTSAQVSPPRQQRQQQVTARRFPGRVQLPSSLHGVGAGCCCLPTLNFSWVRRGHRCRDSELASERLVSLLGAVPTGGLGAPSHGPAEGGAAGGGAAGRGWAGVAETLPRPLQALCAFEPEPEVPRSQTACTSQGWTQRCNPVKAAFHRFSSLPRSKFTKAPGGLRS